jgi:hypothetical protein
MDSDILQQLRGRGAAIRERWEALLRIERVNGPLANPDILVHLIPDSLARILTLVEERRPRAPLTLAAANADRSPPCDCGYNPYLAYFVAGEQAILETVVLLQSEMPRKGNPQNDIAEIVRAIRRLTRDEVDAFCAICTHRGSAAKCRHPAMMAK